MVTHMKTTVEIADALLREAKRIAAKERTTVRALLEEGLRRTLEGYHKKPRFRLRDASYGQGGLQPDVKEGSWERLRDLIYEGRGT
jgi:hypothetical protein